MASRLGLAGEVGNDTQGAWIEASGEPQAIEAFRRGLEQAPAPAVVSTIREEPATWHDDVPPVFRVAPSRIAASGSSALAPDLAPCPDCLRELLDPADRRHRYPFIACARCGPRYTVTAALPYDRERTSLVDFPLCTDCAREYSNPADRRFHAEAIACPACGPQVRACAPDGHTLATGDAAIRIAVAALADGRIVAVHATGGFQLWVDATNVTAVHRLRERKHRDAKPFAVMAPTLDDARELASLTEQEAGLLASASAPIVLLRKPAMTAVAEEVAPDCATLGLCLPASPLQFLICRDFGRPVVATSGNISEEAICHDPAEAVTRLGAIADVLLVHNRKILQPVDDPVLRVVAGMPRLLRRARGYTPVPLPLADPVDAPGLAMGGQMKATLALIHDDQLVLGPHLGDMDTVSCRARHASTRATLESLLRIKPAWVACDMHPDYATTVLAREMPLPRLEVQHHHAHLLAVLAEHPHLLDQPVLGIIWDGTGYGPDGTIWGGEFLLARGHACHRVARFRPFPLPGGDRAARDARRCAYAWLHDTLGETTANEIGTRMALSTAGMSHLCHGGAGTMKTSSVGRLFDAVAALTGIRTVNRFEGEAAMAVEAAALEFHGQAAAYPFEITAAPHAACECTVRLTGPRDGWHMAPCRPGEGPSFEIDTAPMAAAILRDLRAKRPVAEIAARFHLTLVEAAAAIAGRIDAAAVVIGGGCFQNKLLMEAGLVHLDHPSREIAAPSLLPANDGGIAAGQAIAGRWLHRG